MWEYEGTPINFHEDLHEYCVAIVYEITFKGGKKYIGKKQVRSLRRLKATKKQLAIRKNYKRVEMKNIPFIDYAGTSEFTENLVPVKKEILHQCSNKKTATYLEAGEMFHVNAIFNTDYLNKNIQGCYFDNSLDGLIDIEAEIEMLTVEKFTRKTAIIEHNIEYSVPKDEWYALIDAGVDPEEAFQQLNQIVDTKIRFVDCKTDLVESIQIHSTEFIW